MPLSQQVKDELWSAFEVYDAALKRAQTAVSTTTASSEQVSDAFAGVADFEAALDFRIPALSSAALTEEVGTGAFTPWTEGFVESYLADKEFSGMDVGQTGQVEATADKLILMADAWTAFADELLDDEGTGEGMISTHSAADLLTALRRYQGVYDLAQAAVTSAGSETSAISAAILKAVSRASEEAMELSSFWTGKNEVGPVPAETSWAEGKIGEWIEADENMDVEAQKFTDRFNALADMWEDFPSDLLAERSGGSSELEEAGGIPTWVWWVLGLGVVGGVAAYAVSQLSGGDE